jgi:type I protein arginine methyltransferase
MRYWYFINVCRYFIPSFIHLSLIVIIIARAGAAKVYAIECSSIVEQARAIIADNGFSDRIEVIQGKMEEINLPVEYVDIIISEWMGYFLLYESMLDTVLYARDKYLRPQTGIMLPDKAVLYLCGIEDEEYRREKVSRTVVAVCRIICARLSLFLTI